MKSRSAAAGRWRRTVAPVDPVAVAAERRRDRRRAVALVRVPGQVVGVEVVAQAECQEEVDIVVLEAGLLGPGLLYPGLDLEAERLGPIVIHKQRRQRGVLLEI